MVKLKNQTIPINKPWAILRMSRKAYCAARPWKRVGVSRKLYEDFLVALPDELIEKMMLEGQAERLLKEVFGQNSFEDK